MRYKALTVLAILLALTISGAAQGQSQNAQLEAARAELQAGRDQIIREDLQLGEEELSGFWPVYEQYIADLAPIRDRKAVLVGRFMAAYRGGEFTIEFAEWLIAENFAVKGAWTDVQESFVERFKVVLSVQQVARFYQLENKLDAEVDAQMALIVPLVE
jgi:hypothetical protein